ncbi:Uncharacterized protein Fot_39554 [Forsythia ovata]|uniref:Uncharacterized protein n=1 Tax=Forsythia ovata TaxID=205694 RepID=A0ABD1S527_9LAMI
MRNPFGITKGSQEFGRSSVLTAAFLSREGFASSLETYFSWSSRFSYLLHVNGLAYATTKNQLRSDLRYHQRTEPLEDSSFDVEMKTFDKNYRRINGILEGCLAQVECHHHIQQLLLLLQLQLAYKRELGGPAFAIAVVLACVVMYDTTGIRLHAGRQAELLNQIVCELPPEHPVANVRPLRDSLGHTHPFRYDHNQYQLD